MTCRQCLRDRQEGIWDLMHCVLLNWLARDRVVRDAEGAADSPKPVFGKHMTSEE